jgi:hypothetical protein
MAVGIKKDPLGTDFAGNHVRTDTEPKVCAHHESGKAIKYPTQPTSAGLSL